MMQVLLIQLMVIPYLLIKKMLSGNLILKTEAGQH